MKKSINFILAAFVAFSSLAFNATAAITSDPAKETVKANPYNAQLAQDSQLRFQLTFQNPDKKKLTIAIKDKENTTLFTETTTSEAYLRLFDLSTLGDGKYTFEVLGGKNRYTQSFEISTQTNRVVLARN
ncbi:MULTISPECIES: hypothetical protein [unclassified Siphonobacter]|uniref:hypothetical protein n=1 Tax=unclassified Siphonobacter TaxID=2635712 RepID=UPI000CBB3A3B|nr:MULTISPECIES: hypothetical protein [unclassified Siphonobacter]MDQ1088045.1 hypothetical protein [Siphonobacter sp. SORGH_AS_1065]MDR6194196.1 hypothetical protein [Siphonobacter sp. SORGH_AS_0500]PKK36987.1 hypothetical protein BWI96_08890 [Siphonobacter sp. SORGH_AS_0500]